MSHPSAPEAPIPKVELSGEDGTIDHNDEAAEVVKSLRGDGAYPPLVFGTASFGYGTFTDRASLSFDTCYRLVRLALRSGITAFDTAPYYHPSEIVLGQVLDQIQLPRSSYFVSTKAGKYGGSHGDHDYSPDTIRRSVERSLRRLRTDYLDAVYLHDVEFGSDMQCPPGDSRNVELPKAGPGDKVLLQAVKVLRDMQKEGKIKLVGICGYPLPVLLHLARLVLDVTGEPLDVIQTYAHQTLMNTTLGDYYLGAFTNAGVNYVTNASPLAMGFLTTEGRPPWTPSQEPVEAARRQAVEVAREDGHSLEELACDYGYRPLRQDGKLVPIVLGCKSLEEMQMSLGAYVASVQGKGDLDSSVERVREVFKQLGVLNHSWQSPAP